MRNKPLEEIADMFGDEGLAMLNQARLHSKNNVETVEFFENAGTKPDNAKVVSDPLNEA